MVAVFGVHDPSGFRFATRATNLGDRPPTLATRIARAVLPDVRQIIARDLVASQVEALIRGSGSQASGDSRRPALNRDGRLVAFEAATIPPGGGAGGQTEIQVVDRRAPPPTGRPVIIAPATRSAFDVRTGSTLTLAWTAVPNAASYGIEFTGPNRAFANPNGVGPDGVNGFGGAGGAFLTAGTPFTVLLNAGIPPGTYQLRVVALSAAGEPGGTFSDAVTIILTSGAGPVDRPTILSPAAGPLDRGATVTFAWTLVAGAGQYLFEFTGPGGAFANPNGTGPDPANGFGSPTGGGLPVAGTSFTAVVPPIAPGVYQVRVLGFSGTTPIGLASDALTLTVR